jgi:hypothetical protein
MLQRRDQVSQLDQALHGQPVARRGGGPIGPAHRQRHPSSRSSLADEHELGPRTAALQDDSEPLAGEGVEAVSDQDRGGAPVFTGASFGIAASLPSRNRCRPSPCAWLSQAPTTTAAPPRPDPLGRRWARPDSTPGARDQAEPGRFPCSLRFTRRRRSPALPLRPRHGYPAALHRGPTGRHPPACQGVPHPTCSGWVRTAPGPYPPRFEPVSL